jgi:hypothetical protein
MTVQKSLICTDYYAPVGDCVLNSRMNFNGLDEPIKYLLYTDTNTSYKCKWLLKCEQFMEVLFLTAI